MAGGSAVSAPNGHRSAVRTAAPAPQKTPKKKSAKRGLPNGDRNLLPEVGAEGLVGERYPGDVVDTPSAP